MKGENRHEDQFLKSLGSNIQAIRKSKCWSQERLSFESGLHRTYIGAVERGERNISILNLRRIAQALGISLARLLDSQS